MTVLKPQRPLQPLKPIDPTKPKHLAKKPRLANSALKSRMAEEIPEFGTGSYVDAMRNQDQPHKNRSTLTTTTSSISAMRLGQWLNPPHPMPDYLTYNSGSVG